MAGASELIKSLAPTGTLRAALNFGNSVLVQGTAEVPRGVTVDLARELARRLDVPLQFIAYKAAREVFEALRAGAWDIAFLAIEPAREAEIEFTAPYVIIEGVYLVPADSPLKTVAEVDRPGVRIGVNKGSAYDLYLTRTLKAATLARGENGVELFAREKLEAAGGIRQQLVAYAKNHSGVRVLEGRFMEIRQAMGAPKGRAAAAHYLRAFVEEMKASSFVATALARSGQLDAAVAPAAE